MGRLRRIVAAAAAATLAPATPAVAYRVYLDHDADADLGTFDNVVEGLDDAPVTVTILLGPEDADLDHVAFALAWNCHEIGFEGVPHGDIEWPSVIPPSPPFTDPSQYTCTGFGCGCVAFRGFESPVGTPRAPGAYRFAVLGFTRDPAHDWVRFEVDCWECAYVPGDEELRSMTFTSMIPVDAATWGRTKADYR